LKLCLSLQPPTGKFITLVALTKYGYLVEAVSKDVGTQQDTAWLGSKWRKFVEFSRDVNEFKKE